MIDQRRARARLEDRLILACVRTSPGPADQQRIAELAQPTLDWPYLIERATQQNVIPLLFRNLSATCPAQVPAAALVQLRDLATRIAQQNLLLCGQLFQILGLLERAGVPAFPFKGPALASQVYGNLALRQFSDLDIWIRPQDFLRVRELLMAAGLQPFMPPPEQTLPGYTRRHHEYGFASRDEQVHVETMWRIIERPFTFPARVERWWEQLETVELLGRPVQALPAGRLLLSLCVHGSKHLWERLSWVCDVAELLRAYQDLDWAALLVEARAEGCERMLLLGVYLAHQLLDAPLPAGLLRRAEGDRDLLALADVAWELLFRPDDYPQSIYQTRHLYQLRMLSRPRDRVRVLMRYSYSLLNPAHVYRKYGLGPLKAMFGAR